MFLTELFCSNWFPLYFSDNSMRSVWIPIFLNDILWSARAVHAGLEFVYYPFKSKTKKKKLKNLNMKKAQFTSQKL